MGNHGTRMAVPYRACGTPSLRSDFKHPDVALCLAQLAYMQRGLTLKQIRECLSALFETTEAQQKKAYRYCAQL